MIDDKIILQTLAIKYEPQKAYSIYQDFVNKYRQKHLHKLYNTNNRNEDSRLWYEHRSKVMYRYMNIHHFNNDKIGGE
jgi:hypothetical protein